MWEEILPQGEETRAAENCLNFAKPSDAISAKLRGGSITAEHLENLPIV
jgi:hypothetical protein